VTVSPAPTAAGNACVAAAICASLMKRLHIDFVATPLWRLPVAARARQILIGLAALALLAGAAIAWQWRQLEQQIAATTEAIARARHAIVQHTPPPRSPLLLSAQQIAAVNHAIGQLNIPWPAVLDGFESVATADVALLQIEPDPRRRLVKGVAEAKNHQRMLAYLAALGAAAPFTGAMVSKQEINEKDPHRPLRFLFEARLDERPFAAVAASAADEGDE
jgi:hypothetical protein